MNSISKNQWISISIAVLIISAFWIGISAFLPGTEGNPGLSAPQAGFTAPDFTLTTLEGDEVTLSELEGHPVILNLWASWCTPCKAEMPAIQNIHEEFADEGLIILAVNITSQDSLDNARDFIEKRDLTFTVPLDTYGEVAELYNLHAFPSTYFIDHNGVIQEVVLGGPMAEALLRTRVENLMEVE